MEITATFRDFASLAAPAAIAALWQSGALAAAVALCLRFAPRTAASDRFKVWAAGFAAVVLLPFLPVLAAVLFPSSAAAPASAAPHHFFAIDARWSLAIAALWLAASVYRLADLALHTLRLRKLWRSAAPISPADLPASLREQLAAARRPAAICSTQELDRPGAIGFFAPRILIPAWLLARLTPGELEQVVLHESEHLRRRDDWTNLAQKLTLAAFPLNPALLWIERRLCREREIACDEGVVRRTRSPRAYATCLASLAERGLQHRAEALSLGAWQRRPELADRVHRILRRSPALSPAAAKTLFIAAICALAASSVEFACCPQFVAFVAPAAAAHTQIAAAPAPVLPQSSPLVSATSREKRSPRLRSTQSDSVKAVTTIQTASAGADLLLRSTPAAPVAPQQMLLTRLLRTVPPNAAPIATTDSDSLGDIVIPPYTTDSHSNSKPALPAALPLRSYWLDFQL